MANSYDVRMSPFQMKPQEVVNWNSCTAEEILNYEQEGQEVPEQYLRWAEEMSAAMNVQDDVTYEMANTTPGAENANGNAAQNFRSELADSGVSLKQQGKIFISESQGKEEDTLGHIENMAPMLNQTQAIEEEAGKVAEETKTQLQSITDQINAQLDELNDRPKFLQGRQRRGEVAGLQAVAGALATGAAAKIEGMAGQAQDIQGAVNEGAVSSQLSQDYGTETVAIGGELLGVKQGGIMGILQGIGNFYQDIFTTIFGIDSKRKVGKEAIEQGTETLTVGQQGMQIAEEVADANGIAIEGIGQAAENAATGADAGAGADDGGDEGGEPTPQETAATQTPTKSASAKPAEGDNPLEVVQEDPSKILTDPNEIIKRKERRGLA